MKVCYLIITDFLYFPGTLATVNSILNFQDTGDIVVINNERYPITRIQSDLLSKSNMLKIIDSSVFAKPNRYIDAWELKAHAACDLCNNYDAIVGIDSDCLLCASVDDQIGICIEKNTFLGGQDGSGEIYNQTYSVYGIDAPCVNRKYVSTSIYFCPVNERTKALLQKWSECCNFAEFNDSGDNPGHGDQGVLNALIYANKYSRHVKLLPNQLWSQHWTYWDDVITHKHGKFINSSFDDKIQRAFHCGGTDKFWMKSHSDRILDSKAPQNLSYTWFLAMLFFGHCSSSAVDPARYIPPAYHHLTQDAVKLLQQIIQVHPAAGAS